MEQVDIEMDIIFIIIVVVVIITIVVIIIIIITVVATLSGRERRRQVHYWLHSQLAFCDKKTTNMLHHAGKRDAKI